MFSRILIANRGEIACRIMATARQMGIETVAVHSTADAQAQHVQMAEIVLPLGGRGDYLDKDAVVAAAVASGAEAIEDGAAKVAAATLATGVTLTRVRRPHTRCNSG